VLAAALSGILKSLDLYAKIITPPYNFQYIKHGIIHRKFYGAQGIPLSTGSLPALPVVECALRTDQLNYGEITVISEGLMVRRHENH